MIGKRYAPDADFDVGTAISGLAVDAKGRVKMSPENDLEDDEMLLNTNDVIPVVDGEDVSAGNVTVTVAGSAITDAVFVPVATRALVTDADEVATPDGTVTLSVDTGAVDGATFTPDDTHEVIAHEDELTLEGGDGTVDVAIASGTPAYSFVEPDDKKLIAHEDVLTLEDSVGTVTVSIVAGVATYTFVAP